MFDTQLVKDSFGRAAAQYDARASVQHKVRAEALTLARECWTPGMHILDAGCGTGAFVTEAKPLGWRVTGIDLSPGMCTAAKGTPVNADAVAMPFADATFDGVFSSLMLQWANDPLSALREMKRVTKPRGHAVVATLVEGTLGELKQAFTALDEAPHVSEFSTPLHLQMLATRAGFAVVSSATETVTEHYPHIVALMRSIKSIGAANKDYRRNRGLMTPYQLARVTRAYPRTPDGLPVTWKPFLMVLGA